VDHADLTVPPGARPGLIPLHPANDPSRGSLLFDDLAEELPPLGVAVLRYDCRPGEDIPLEAQADDALEAAADLRAAVGDPALPIVLWGRRRNIRFRYPLFDEGRDGRGGVPLCLSRKPPKQQPFLVALADVPTQVVNG
jgi:hypothetical protein